MDPEILASSLSRIVKSDEILKLVIFNDGLNVSESALRLYGLDFLALANMGKRLGVPTITRRYSGGPIVRAEFELMERANVPPVPL